jgi:hypothetical protein
MDITWVIIGFSVVMGVLAIIDLILSPQDPTRHCKMLDGDDASGVCTCLQCTSQ